MAMNATPSVPASDSDVEFVALEKTPSRGRELWNVAGNKVRRQVTVIDAFRRHRRDNTFLRGSGTSIGGGSLNSLSRE
jgi:surface antigen